VSVADVIAGERAWWVEQGDSLRVLPTLDVDAISAVVTDPPYGMANKTNSKRFTGGNRVLRPVEGRDDWPEVAGDDRPFDPTPWLVFPKVCLWGANHFGARLPVGTMLVWIKKADGLFGTFLSDAEVGWMKGGHGVYCFRHQFPPPSRAEEAGGRCAHPNQKPVNLMAWVMDRMRLPVGAVVLDPYCGSGSTGVACILTGRRFIGVEVNPEYAAVARGRIANTGLTKDASLPGDPLPLFPALESDHG
jgi:site-specific DNA-methyltransferase (adenine-specific)